MSWLSTAFRIISVADAGWKLIRVARDKDATTEDKIAAVLHGIFAGVQIGDLVVRNISGISSGVKFGMSVASGVTDVARFGGETYAKRIKKGEKWTKMDTVTTVMQGTGMALFRFGDIVGAAKALSSSPLHHEWCDKLITVSEGIGTATAAGAGLISIVANCRRVYEKYLENLRNRALQAHAGAVDGNAAQAMTLRQQDPEFVKEESAEKLSDEQLEKELYKIINTGAGLDSLPAIPLMLHSDPAFRHFCLITGKPIRHLLVPNAPFRAEHSHVMYDRVSIDKWLEDHPGGEIPPGWPSALIPPPFRRHHLQRDLRRQAAIEAALQEVIFYMQQAHLEVAATANGAD